MRSEGHRLPMPLCLLVRDILHTACVIKGSGGANKALKQCKSCLRSMNDVLWDLQQMIDYPGAFLFTTVASRWDLVFGNNHMFGRKGKLQCLIDAAHRIQPSASAPQGGGGEPGKLRRKKEVVMVDGHAGSGKSRLVREMRKPLQNEGWLFLRCKFSKGVQSEPLSVIALGLDEYFSLQTPCSPAGGPQEAMSSVGPSPANMRGAAGCSCVNSSCPRRICERLETLIGLDGLKCLSEQMPSLSALVHQMYANRSDSLSRASGGRLQVKFHTHHMFGTLLDTIASFCPVSFFVDDLQWADSASFELLTSLINRVVTNFNGDYTNQILFIGAYRTDGVVEEMKLKKMIKEFEGSDTINTTKISLHGFDVESLNEMVSDALCLPRRKTLPLSQLIHTKTQGFPLFVVEFLDALWTDKLLVRNAATGWEWDLDVIDMRGISQSVAELLSCKLKVLPQEVLSGVQVLSCFGSHVDVEVLEAVKIYDGSSGEALMPALEIAQKEDLVEKAGPTYTFTHDLIQQAAFNIIPATHRASLLQKLVACLTPFCEGREGGSDSFLIVTVDLINRIGRDTVCKKPTQSQLYARLNLEAGKKYMSQNDYGSAVNHFKAGISFLGENYWTKQYDLSLLLFENSALANYPEGSYDEVMAMADQVLSNAKNFEDRFESYCVQIMVMSNRSVEEASSQICQLLGVLGEIINPTMVSPQSAIMDVMDIKGRISGDQKNKLLRLSPMSDGTKLMTMRLMGMLAQLYVQTKLFLTGFVVCKMIRLSLQFGHCEDTIVAMAIFSSTIGNKMHDVEEAYALAQTSLSLMKFYDANQLIPRVYPFIYGSVLLYKDPMQSLIDPLLKSVQLTFSNGHYTHSQIVFNSLLYLVRSWHAGKRLPLILNELNALCQQEKRNNHMNILQPSLVQGYNLLSTLSGISLDSDGLAQPFLGSDDVIETAMAKNDSVMVQFAMGSALSKNLYTGDFVSVARLILKYREFFQMLNEKEMRMNEHEMIFNAGLVSFHMARATRETHWVDKGTNIVATFEKWKDMNDWNFEHCYYLLKAEMHHTSGESTKAAEAFTLAVEASESHFFLQHTALAAELAAYYFRSIGARDMASKMIYKSRTAYLDWGAKRKVQEIDKLLQLKWLDQTS